MSMTLRLLHRSVLGACVLLAACAAVAAQQGGPGGSAGSAGTPAGGASGDATSPSTPGAGAAARPKAPKAKPLPDGTYRDLQGRTLVPPAAMFGAKIEACPPLVAKHLDLDPAKNSYLAEVMPGCPAAKAGLEAHDIITAVDGLSDAGEQTIRKAIRGMKPGDALQVTVRRGATSKQATVILEPWHPDHMVRHLQPEHFQPLPPLPTQVPATMAQVQALEQRVAALEKEVAELRAAIKSGR